MRILRIVLPLTLTAAGFLAGCGSGPLATSVSGSLAIAGQVHGGQQPVDLATIQLYTAGKTGDGSAATPMIASLVQSDANGFFNITGDYTCANPTDQVYLVATGGNPGLSSGTVNHALVMVDALGNCSDLLAPNYYITVNEVTTAAAAWALAPFMASYASVGSSSTNAAGLANAFLDAQLLAGPQTGVAATLPSNLTIQSGKLYALADVLAPCINSDGTAACGPLFAAATPTGGSAPSNTLNAALNIVEHPGENPTGVWNCILANAPFPTSLKAAPNDWTMALTVSGGGLSSPTSLDIDAQGNVWVADEPGALSEFSPQGTPLSGSTGFGVGALEENYGLTIDTNGFVWVANEESTPNASGSLTEFDGSTSGTPGAIVPGNGGTNFYDSTTSYPVSLSADTNGDIFIDNYVPYSSVTVYNSSGGYVANLASGNVSYPIAVAADASHGVWIANYGDDTITHSDSSGNILSRPTCCNNANGLATDALGNVWVANYAIGNGGSFSEVAPDGSVTMNQVVAGGVQYPAGINVDAAQNVWIADYRGEAITEIAGNGGGLTPGTGISPSYGYGYAGPPPASPLLLEPYDLVPDASGNIWVSNEGNNNLVMFFGLAAPTDTPTRPVPVAP